MNSYLKHDLHLCQKMLPTMICLIILLLSCLTVNGTSHDEQSIDFLRDLSEATQVKDCDFYFLYDQLNHPSKTRTEDLLIQSMEKR